MNVLDATCYFCDQPIDPLARETWRRVVGWERHAGVRASGKHGGSDITLREPRDQYAHPLCISRYKQGVNANQGTLV